MSDPNLNLGVGGGSPPLGGGPSLQDDEAALRKGSVLPLIVGIVAAIGLVVGLGVVLLSGEDNEQYEVLGRNVNGMKAEHFDQFWGCALPNQPLDRLRTNQDLGEAIQKRASSSPQRYAAHVRSKCLVKLTEHGPRLRQLIPPEDLGAQLDALQAALTQLTDGWNGYLDALDRSSEGYDEGAAAPHLSKIAKGWYDYRTAHGQLNDTVRERLHGE
ncbi:MAG: hypothetical protein KF729_23915 [Sandaracinaceae bacterium]|nr:hypothetical protein [Sandaracinaceae bacterium]